MACRGRERAGCRPALGADMTRRSHASRADAAPSVPAPTGVIAAAAAISPTAVRAPYQYQESSDRSHADQPSHDSRRGMSPGGLML